MPMKSIPIFFTFDNNYAEPAAVAFFSLLDKAKSDVFYEMYVLHSNIKNDKQKLLTDIVKLSGKGSLHFISTNGFLSEQWNTGSFNFQAFKSSFTVDTLFRCFAARFFPQYDKIIYSDVDVVFADDISEIYHIDLHDKYIAGVKNPFMKHSSLELSHLKPEHHAFLHDKYLAGGI